MIVHIGKENSIRTKKDYYHLESSCELNNIEITDDVVLVITDVEVKEGVINETIFLDELFLFFSIKLIITNIESESLMSLADYYKVELLQIM